MKKLWVLGALLVVLQAPVLFAGRTASPMAALEKRQLMEWKALKAKEKDEKQTMKRDHLSKSARAMLKREMAIEERNLLARQKSERERLKRNQKLLKRSEKRMRTGR